MKKIIPYILLGIIILAAAILISTSDNNKKRTLDERISFRKKDKIPYGTYVAYEGLKNIFPKASISTNNQEPGYWDSLSNYDGGQALIIISPGFNPDEYEMKKLIHFIESGNDVFVSAMKVSYYAEKFMKCDIFYPGGSIDNFFYFPGGPDSLTVSLNIPSDKQQKKSFSYPGKGYDFWFYGADSATTTVLGHNKDGKANFIHLRAGKGNLFVQLAPTAFTNYFLLHKNNISYYENALSLISRNVTKVVWDEYYLYKKHDQDREMKKKGWLSVMMNIENSAGQKSFRAALWLLILLLFVYVLLEMRRKQRYIPVITKPRNDSLDFVKTIGRLYYDKGDHTNLCRKMSAYFLEHVRNRYKLSTTELNEEFIKNLQFKTGVDESEIRSIVFFIRDMENVQVVSDHQLGYFHKQLESFYNKT